MRGRKKSAFLFLLAICIMAFFGTGALADNLPYFTVNADHYLPSENMEVHVFHTEELEGKKYLEILWLDTGNVVFRTEFKQEEVTIPAPQNAGTYKIRLVLDSEEQEKRFTVAKDGETAGVLRGEISKNSAGDLLGIFLYWEGAKGQAYHIERTATDGTRTSSGPVYLTGWTDINIEPNTTYTYTVSDGTKIYNSVVMDTTEFIPSEYYKNHNTGVIELQVGNPYMTVNIPDENPKSVPIDPENIRIVPVLQQGRVMLPVRAVIEAMGQTIAWKSDSRSVLITAWEKAIEIPIGSKTVFVNGEPRSFDVPAELTDGRTRVPIRHLESLGCEIEWCRETRGVIIRFHTDS